MRNSIAEQDQSLISLF